MSTAAPATDQRAARQRLAQLIGGYAVTQAIYVAVRLGIADRLRDGPCDAEHLARASGADRRSLHRLMRALASFGLFAEDALGRFQLTELAKPLCSDAPGSLRDTALSVGEIHYPAFGELLHGVETGAAGFDKALGMPLFDFFAAHPDVAGRFDHAMDDLRSRAAEAMLEAYDFSRVGTLVDVGGGAGGLLATVLTEYPSMRGVLFDLPHVVERAPTRLDDARVGGRCERIGGDFFESVPPGGDVYLLRHIVHDWDDKRAIRILRNCSAAMAGGGRLLLIESVIAAGNGPSLGKMMDLVMMAMTGGTERTEDEYRELLEVSGFHLSRVIPTSAGIHVIEASPITSQVRRRSVKTRTRGERERSMGDERDQQQPTAAAKD